MSRVLFLNSIAQLHGQLGVPPSNHPLVSVIDLANFSLPATYMKQRVVTSFYTITFKSRSAQAALFGRQDCDFKEGVLYAQAPEEVFSISEPIEKGDYQGWVVSIHPDLLMGKDLFRLMKSYSFFSYQATEALHLSSAEKASLSAVIEQLTTECYSRLDHLSPTILVSLVGLLLDFIQRYYERQFITRHNIASGTVAQFTAYLETYFATDAELSQGLPSVSYFADKLHVSPNYLSDLLRKNTGLSAQEYIHSQLIKKAKNLLLEDDKTVAEVAYQLGFEYPAYFSRIFKHKTGSTPVEFRRIHAN